MQEFGLNHIDEEDLAWGFIEFHPYIGQCRFNNCRHAGEPGCALAQAAQEGKISRRRFNFYHRLAKSYDATFRE
jgi:ribosome biogenesis GTPase